MTTRVLVASSVHPPDDPRIRHKLVESLRDVGEVTLAVREPGPADATGFVFVPLRGSRLRRTFKASRLILAGRYDVASVHDPELLPAAILSGLVGRRVVFDLHEDFPAQLGGKAWMPRPLRRPASWAAQALLWLAERTIEVTLAEPGYAVRLRKPHPMFPNHLADLAVSVVPPDERAGVVYLGDITVVRGLAVAVEALRHAGSRPPLTLIGRCAPDLRTRLEEIARTGGISLTFTGFLPPAEALLTMSRHAVAVSPWLDEPNYRDSMPTKLLEYLALGVPVVASDLPGSRKMVEGLAGVVWVPPSDPVALGEAIERVLNEPEITAAAVSGADDVRRRFRWPTDDVRRFYVENR